LPAGSAVHPARVRPAAGYRSIVKNAGQVYSGSLSGRPASGTWPAGAAATRGGLSVTIGGSIALIIIGAILRFAITWKPSNIDLQVVGLILMIGGVVGLAISIAVMVSRRRRSAGAQVYEERSYTEPPP
jgi:uncharacterized protein DUF6458